MKNELEHKREINNNRKHVGEGLFFICLIIFMLVMFRFAYITIFKNVQHVNLSQQTRNLYTQTSTLKSKRGSIYDANGQPIAEDTSTYSMYAILDKNQKSVDGKPLYVTDKSKTARVLSEHLPISYKQALNILNPKNNNRVFQVEFGNAGQNISLTTRQKIAAQHLTGINFIQQQARLYPNGTFASHLVGLASPVTNNKNGKTDLVGQMGLENEFNNELKGRDGFKEIQKNNYQNSKNQPAKDGNDVYTTLDYRLQTLLENEMSNVYNEAKPSEMNAVLMNAKTGEVLGATQRPTFDATTKKGINNIWRNTLTQDLYEPGSTMKVFTMAASIDSHHYNGNNTYVSGKDYIDGRLIPDWNTNGWGRITYDMGFALSSNVAMAHLEQNMGADTWKDYINRFSLLKSADTGLNDSIGSMQYQYPIEQANTAFGQGIQVTTMQMMRGLSAIANNGNMLQPRFVSKVVNPQTKKTVKDYQPKVVGNPISSETAKQVRKHMEDVVYKSYGIGRAYQIPGYKIAAKTGTAQISSDGSYSSGDDNYLYSVAGMAPADNPKYVLYITMKKPNLNHGKTASQYLSEIFNPVMKRSLQEDEDNSVEQVRVPKLTGANPDDAKKTLSKLGLQTSVIGNGDKITKQSIASGNYVIKGQKITLLTNTALK